MSLMDRIHPKLVPYVMALKSHKFGLQGALAKIDNIECGSIIAKRERRWGDRFLLRILYCDKRLTWQVLMNPKNLMEPPDFILEDDFLADAHHDLIKSQVPSLAHWQPSDPKCLLNVVLELLELYKQFQCNFLVNNRDSRLFIEYHFLMKCSDFSDSDIEIFVHNPSRVSFLFRLKVDFSRLPVILPKHKSLALLLVELMENSKNVVSFIPHEELNEVLENVNLLELKNYMLLVEYVCSVQEQIQGMVNEIVHRLNMRKLLYCYIIQAFESAILNGDNITFHSVSFLLEHNNNYFILNITIPLSFPDDPPEIFISLMRKQKSGTALFVKLKNFNYDSRWKVDKIFRNMYEFIKNAAVSQYFKNSSNNEEKNKK